MTERKRYKPRGSDEQERRLLLQRLQFSWVYDVQIAAPFLTLTRTETLSHANNLLVPTFDPSWRPCGPLDERLCWQLLSVVMPCKRKLTIAADMPMYALGDALISVGATYQPRGLNEVKFGRHTLVTVQSEEK